MNKHPAKLIVLFPMRTPRLCEPSLSALDDAIVVHHDPVSGRFAFEHRPMVMLSDKGPNSYAATLCRLAANLEQGYQIVIVERDLFIDDLVELAREHATDEDRGTIERAAQVIGERTMFQVFDHLFEGPADYEIGRQLIAMRERRTKPDRGEQPGLNLQAGAPVPRAEQLWHVCRHQWCSPRVEQAARAMWENWCRRGRRLMLGTDLA